MSHDTHVLELAIFTVKPQFVGQMPDLRDSLREALKSFPGLIAYRGYCPMDQGRMFVDIAEWENHECAVAVASAFNNGDRRFAGYMNAIESLSFMSHFVPEAR
ncbi:hypothetical protein [Pseudomonas huaxiensis]|uniref:hypothetical protein n=1 Tax=Pseudomonas huaxiensis TaxID=2213017 RepID=UPI000DA6C5DA|nr:hypothetical protein [Pseudomonas huaxiensis]